METHNCPRCGNDKPLNAFYRRGPGSGKRAGQIMTPCSECANKLRTVWSHENGESVPMAESRKSPVFLGVYVAERALSKFFDHITRMPYGNPGYDFRCGRGFNIDVKCSTGGGTKGGWYFNIHKNCIADFFLCLAFDNRESLDPQHIWLVPGDILRDKNAFSITNSPKSLEKWVKYERSLDRVNTCCDTMRSEV
jgi:hypothetical protein